LQDLKKPWRLVVPKTAGVRSFALHERDVFTIESTGAPRHKLVRYRLGENAAVRETSVVLPEASGTLRTLAAASGALYVTSLEAGVSRLRALAYSGGAPREIPLAAGQPSISGIAVNPTRAGCVANVETWTLSPRWLACEAARGCDDTEVLPSSPV